jgi:hypothetical protein
MNVYIDGLGYSEEESTRRGMLVVKSASLMMGSPLRKFNTTPAEAAAYLAEYFAAVTERAGSRAFESICRVFDALKECEELNMSQRADEWPSKDQVREHLEAYQKNGNSGLLRAIQENQKDISASRSQEIPQERRETSTTRFLLHGLNPEDSVIAVWKLLFSPSLRNLCGSEWSLRWCKNLIDSYIGRTTRNSPLNITACQLW